MKPKTSYTNPTIVVSLDPNAFNAQAIQVAKLCDDLALHQGLEISN